MKRLLLALLLMPLMAVAQDITVIDWDVLRIDTVQPPVYCETVPLASNYRSHEYTVQVEYPEWKPLTAAEARIMERFTVADTLAITSYVGTMNHRGYLHIEFCPVVKDGKGYRKLVSGRVTVCSRLVAAQHRTHRMLRSPMKPTASPFVEGSRAVRISTTNEGAHVISREQLARWGFSDPSRVRVLGYGGHPLNEKLGPGLHFDALPEVPAVVRADGALVFWMNGRTSYNNAAALSTFSTTPRHNTNYCARRACYFLVEGEPQTATEPSSQTTAKRTLNTFTHTVVYEKDEFAYAPLGRRLFERNAQREYTLRTPMPKGGTTTGRVLVCYSSPQEGTLKVTIPGTSVESANITFKAPGEYEKATIASKSFAVNCEGNAVVVRLDKGGMDGHLDFIEATYEREMTLGADDEREHGLMFTPNVSGTTAFSITSPTADEVVLVRLPEPQLEGARIMPSADGTFVVDDPRHTYVAFRPNLVTETPELDGIVGPQDLRSDSVDVDMVIITPVSGIFDAEAQRLADAHAMTDGLRCRVVRADKIYNEFSSGTADVMAYRQYMKHLYDHQTVPPRYLLLFGDCAADNRMLSAAWRTQHPDNFLLCYESDNSLSDIYAYVCEDILGMMDDGEGGSPTSDMGDISVGRFTVRTVAEARVMVDKTIRHLVGDPGAWQNRVAVLGDDGDENSHMRYACRIADTLERYHPDMEVRRVMWDAYKRESSAVTNTFPTCAADIQRMIQEGQVMVNYTGHGNVYLLSHESVVKRDDLKEMKNQHLPLWFTAACDVMPIDGTEENVGEVAVLNPDGGAVAFIGTTRTVYASYNHTLNNAFCKALFATDPQGRRYSVGDALRMAKNADGVLAVPNKLHYVLVGDPSLVFGNPTSKVVLDRINGKPVGSGQQLKAGSRATMEGHIVDAQGQAVTDFDGIVAVRVMDSEVDITCNNAAKVKEGPFRFTDRSKLLYEGQDSVRNGRFTLSFIVPVDINYSDREGRAGFYAVSDSLEANGHSTDFIVGGISNELSDDRHGPDVFITLDREDFPEGGTTSPTPYFMASVADSSGINLGAGGIGHSLELQIDGRADCTYDLAPYYTALPDTFGLGQVAFAIPTLTEGEHTLSFRAWDLLNNSTTRTLRFNVDASNGPSLSRVIVSPNPASTHTNIYVTHNCAGQDLDVEVSVYDYAGRHLRTWTAKGTQATPTVYVGWDLTTGSGAPLGAGIYLVRARIRMDGDWSEPEAQKLIINR